jgi:hypothetical protein
MGGGNTGGNSHQLRIRARAVLNILRGRPTAYRLALVAPAFGDDMRNAYVANCRIAN